MDLRYHRYYDEDAETDREIFVPPIKEREILDLEANKEWDKLREFQMFSNGPRPDTMIECCGFPTS